MTRKKIIGGCATCENCLDFALDLAHCRHVSQWLPVCYAKCRFSKWKSRIANYKDSYHSESGAHTTSEAYLKLLPLLPAVGSFLSREIKTTYNPKTVSFYLCKLVRNNYVKIVGRAYGPNSRCKVNVYEVVK